MIIAINEKWCYNCKDVVGVKNGCCIKCNNIVVGPVSWYCQCDKFIGFDAKNDLKKKIAKSVIKRLFNR